MCQVMVVQHFHIQVERNGTKINICKRYDFDWLYECRLLFSWHNQNVSHFSICEIFYLYVYPCLKSMKDKRKLTIMATVTIKLSFLVDALKYEANITGLPSVKLCSTSATFNLNLNLNQHSFSAQLVFACRLICRHASVESFTQTLIFCDSLLPFWDLFIPLNSSKVTCEFDTKDVRFTFCLLILCVCVRVFSLSYSWFTMCLAFWCDCSVHVCFNLNCWYFLLVFSSFLYIFPFWIVLLSLGRMMWFVAMRCDPMHCTWWWIFWRLNKCHKMVSGEDDVVIVIRLRMFDSIENAFMMRLSHPIDMDIGHRHEHWTRTPTATWLLQGQNAHKISWKIMKGFHH